MFVKFPGACMEAKFFPRKISVSIIRQSENPNRRGAVARLSDMKYRKLHGISGLLFQ